MKLFKQSIFLVLTLLLFSCSLDDEVQDYSYEILPIESIDLPSEFILNEVYDIDFTFVRPTDCHGYHNVFVTAENETRTIAVTSIIYSNQNCETLTEDNIVEQSFRFRVIYDQVYVFKIWKGLNDLGEEIFEVIEVPVVN